MFVMSDQVRFEFAGDGSGVDELAWGQQEIWLAMTRQRSWIPIGGPGRLKAGTTLDDVVDDLRYTLGRYQTLRTRMTSNPCGVISSGISCMR